MELNPKQTKAALLLASGDTVTATAEQVGVNRMTIHQWLKEDDNFNAYLNSLKREFVDAGRSAMISAEKSHIENFTEKKIKKINAKTEQGLKKTVLKWTECIYGSRDTSSFPNHCENVLAIDCLGNYAVCCFDAGSRDFFLSHNENEYFTEVVYWMLLPSQPSRIKPMQNNEYLIEQTTLETFDIIDAITPALREAVKHLLVQQGANK
jgi:transposase-like protein